MQAPGKCSKCAGVLEDGFLLELAHGNGRLVTQWVAGIAEASIWMGLKVNDRAKLDVVTYRCQSCGFLESYAR
jgi:hypothetical protein